MIIIKAVPTAHTVKGAIIEAIETADRLLCIIDITISGVSLHIRPQSKVEEIEKEWNNTKTFLS